MNWKLYLEKLDNLEELFDRCDITNYEVLKVLHKYSYNADHHGIVVALMDKRDKTLSKAIISAVTEWPTWAHMMDCTFDNGKDCALRFVLCGDGHSQSEECDPCFDPLLIRSFIRFNNLHGLDTYLVGVSVEGNDEYGYNVIDKPDNQLAAADKPKPPEKSEMQKVLFWIYEDYFNEGDDPIHLTPHLWKWEPKYLERNGAKFIADWDQDGAYIRMITGPSSKIPTWIAKNGLENIADKYQVCLKTTEAGGYDVTFTGIDRPFSDFANATYTVKEDFAKRFVSMQQQITELYDKWIDEKP